MKIFGYTILILFSFLNGFNLNAQVVTWGYSNYGGDSSSVASELSSGVSTIYSTEHSFAATIVYSPPIILFQDNLYESTIGTGIEIDATPTDGYPSNFAYQWYFNGFQIPSMFGGTNSFYTIDGSESSNGTWRIEVTNDAGTTTAEFEYRVFTDADGDGLSDYRESSILSTDPNDSDTDNDGLNDYDEVITYLTDPNDLDSDDDGLNDGIEINTYSSNPLTADTSGDGFSDGFIVGEGLSPTDNYSALRFSTISNVVSNSESYGLYKLSNVKDVEASFKINFDVFDFSAIEIQIKELKSDLDVVDNLYLRTDILDYAVYMMFLIIQKIHIYFQR